MSIAARGWKIVQIIITVCKTSRTEEMKDWKKPFKKLKFSTVRVEKEWAILLDVNDKDLKKIYSLLDGRFQTETIMEPDKEKETWKGKTALLAENVDVKAVKA